MTFDEKLKNYAKLVIEVGVNVQKDQPVYITVPLEGAKFGAMMAECAYAVGAKRVYVDFVYDPLTKINYQNISEETYSEYPAWETLKYNELDKENAAYISVSAPDPDLLKGIPTSKIQTARKAANLANKEHRKKISNSELCWCVVSMPTVSWSKKVFPELSEEDAVAALWDKIFEATRINEADPVAAWKEHVDNLMNRCKYLNDKNIKSLHYVAPGTDLVVELPEGYKWEGGGEESGKGTYFVANMPTEEVFTMPHKYKVNGTLKATKPLVYSGNLIDDFSFTFKDGKIVDFDAKKGKDVLESLLNIDEGSSYLGEVAIVPNSSPVSRANVLFYNTLFDENASCHFAVGSCYPTTIENGTTMTDEELEAAGGNSSLTHNDFMVGSDKLNIEATTHSGEKFLVLKDGEWAF